MTDSDTLLGGGEGGYVKPPDHHGGVAVAEALRAAGVTHVFCLPGGHLAPVNDGCTKLGIEVIGTRHESAAVHMAEAWARCTGRTGVAAVTAGPGFTNCVTGLANAQSTGIPVVVLGGRTPLTLRGRGAVQDVDQESVARVVAKWARSATAPELLGPLVREALAVARSGRPGSAYVDLPTDVLTAEAPAFAGAPPAPAPARADAGAVDEAIALLAAAERPMCVTGGGAFWAGADAALAAFADATGIPVTTTSHCRGLLPDSHPQCVGSLLHGGVGVALADVVLVVGSRFNGNLVFGGPPLWSDHQKIVLVDCDPAAFALNRTPDVALHGDAAAVLSQLAEAWTAEPKKAWADEVRGYAEASLAHWRGEADGDSRGVHPGWLAREVCQAAADAGPGVDPGHRRRRHPGLGAGVRAGRAARVGAVHQRRSRDARRGGAVLGRRPTGAARGSRPSPSSATVPSGCRPWRSRRRPASAPPR